MSAPLAHRVRGEQVPLGENQLRLLEVIVDEEERPLWRARCLQSGNLLNVALDGFVKVPETIKIKPTEVSHDYLGERQRARKWRRWFFIFCSVLLAALALAYQDTVFGWLKPLQDALRSGRIPGLPK